MLSEFSIGMEEKPVLKQEAITDHMPVVKKKRKIDRFNGMPEEEVIQMTLPDRLAPNLDILIVSTVTLLTSLFRSAGKTKC